MSDEDVEAQLAGDEQVHQGEYRGRDEWRADKAVGDSAMMLKPAVELLSAQTTSMSAASAASTIVTVASALLRLKPARPMQAPVRK